jgi:hypothetical protein
MGLMAYGFTGALLSGVAAARERQADRDAARRRTAAMMTRIRRDVVGTRDVRAKLAANWAA